MKASPLKMTTEEIIMIMSTLTLILLFTEWIEMERTQHSISNGMKTVSPQTEQLRFINCNYNGCASCKTKISSYPSNATSIFITDISSTLTQQEIIFITTTDIYLPLLLVLTEKWYSLNASHPFYHYIISLTDRRPLAPQSVQAWQHLNNLHWRNNG